MFLPRLQGTISRRLLVNYSADRDVVARLLPTRFRPLCHGGKAIVGICFIRFTGLRPLFVPEFLGLGSENAAHRVAVEWDSPQGVRQGVYIFRRDTSSLLNSWVGGRVFPGVQNRATFKSENAPPKYSVSYASHDGSTQAQVSGSVAQALPRKSIFKDLASSSEFFKLGAVGFSPAASDDSYQGMRLVVDNWHVEAFEVESVESSFFSNESLFPKNSVHYDHSLIMRNIPHFWKAVTAEEGPTKKFK